MIVHAITRTFFGVIDNLAKKLADLQTLEQIHLDLLQEAISRVLACNGVQKLHVIVSTDPNFSLSEKPQETMDGEPPTTYALRQRIADTRIAYHTCSDWGDNPGSCNALNQVIHTLPHENTNECFVFIFSKEALLDPKQIAQAFEMMKRFPQLAVIGFFRECHWYYSPWQWPQNTAALWRLKCLRDIGGFDRRCEGNDGKTIVVPTVQDPVPLAGMEDFHALLRLENTYHETWFWSMVGAENPFAWRVSDKIGLVKELHDRQIARQAIVMQEWIKELFPNENIADIFNRLFARRLLLPTEPILFP